MAAPVILDPEVFQLPLELDSDAVCPVGGDNRGEGCCLGQCGEEKVQEAYLAS